MPALLHVGRSGRPLRAPCASALQWETIPSSWPDRSPGHCRGDAGDAGRESKWNAQALADSSARPGPGRGTDAAPRHPQGCPGPGAEWPGHQVVVHLASHRNGHGRRDAHGHGPGPGQGHGGIGGKELDRQRDGAAGAGGLGDARGDAEGARGRRQRHPPRGAEGPAGPAVVRQGGELEFLRAKGARGKPGGHPHRAVLARIERAGGWSLRTDQVGEIAVRWQRGSPLGLALPGSPRAVLPSANE